MTEQFFPMRTENKQRNSIKAPDMSSISGAFSVDKVDTKYSQYFAKAKPLRVRTSLRYQKTGFRLD